MSYFSLFKDLLMGSDKIFQLALDGKAKFIMLVNIAILGIFFGISNLVGALQSNVDLPMDGKFAFITPALFSLGGMVTMFGALLGVCMVYWSASRAFGGHGGFALVLDLIGLASIPFWIMAPLLNYVIRFTPSKIAILWLLLLAGAAFLWSYKLLRQSLVVGQGISYNKASIAVACMWIFSISSIYVFLP